MYGILRAKYVFRCMTVSAYKYVYACTGVFMCAQSRQSAKMLILACTVLYMGVGVLPLRTSDFPF